MNNSLSAHRQVLIKRSGRIIERVAPKSEVVNLKCFFIQVAFIYPFKKKQKKKRSGQQARPRHPETPSEWRLFPGAL